jgi:hypothetical protein
MVLSADWPGGRETSLQPARNQIWADYDRALRRLTPRRCLGFVRADPRVQLSGLVLYGVPSLPQPRLHPNELTIPRCSVVGCRITKMIKAYGAPIDDTDAKAMAEYPKKNYGSQ